MRPAWRRTRILWPDGNILRRRWDRLETVVVISLAALFLIAGPAIAIAAGRLADGSMLRQVRAEHAWHRVTATLASRDARRLETAASSWVVLSARASWTAGGHARTGRVPVSPGTGKHGTVAIWVDAAGRLTGPPSARADLPLEVAVVAASAPLGLACILAMAGVGARGALDRRRLADWENCWRAIGPKWSRQL
jgi:hypothetical protein